MAIASPAEPLTALTSALVDDAGLFPPEELDMASAVARHRRDRAAGSPVLTHRFVCPVARLGELRARLRRPAPDDAPLAPIAQMRWDPHPAFEAARTEQMRPVKQEGTLAFMFETRLPQRVTAYAAELPQLQKDYADRWSGLRKRFHPDKP